METPAASPSPALLDVIRPAVRRQKAYHVGTVPGIRVKLNQNESPFGLPPAMQATLAAQLQGLPVNRYPAEQPDALQAALADYLGYPAEGLLLGNGSNELTHTLGLAFIAPGTPVVLPRPMFALYTSVVRLFDGQLIEVPPRPDLQFDTEALLAAVAEHQPALTVLTTPNNPTGLAMPWDDVERIVQASPGFVVVDEAYVEFREGPNAQALLVRYPNVLVMRTFSKAFGLAGLRLGYLMGHPAVIAELLKARLPFMVSHFAQAAGQTLLQHPTLVAERVATLKATTAQLTADLQAIDGVTVVPSETNFVIFKTPVEPETLLARLAQAGVLVRNMSGYPELRGYLRVNAGTNAENKAFMTALKGALSSPQGAG